MKEISFVLGVGMACLIFVVAVKLSSIDAALGRMEQRQTVKAFTTEPPTKPTPRYFVVFDWRDTNGVAREGNSYIEMTLNATNWPMMLQRLRKDFETESVFLKSVQALP